MRKTWKSKTFAVADGGAIPRPIQESSDRRRQREIKNLAKCRNDRKREWSDARCFEIQPTPDVESSSKKERTSKGLELPWSRCCGRIELPWSRCCGRLRVSGKPTRRRKEWERSRCCGWEIEVGADSAAARLVPGADFNCSQRDFSAVFRGNFRAEKGKNGSELMRQIVRKS